MVNSLRLVCDLHVSGWSAHGKEQTANTKRKTKSKATTAMKTTKFFFFTANDNHSPFIFANQNLFEVLRVRAAAKSAVSSARN